VLNTMEAKLLDADVSKQTHDSIVAQVAPSQIDPAKVDPPDKDKKPKSKPVARPQDASMIAGLLLGSPEFQRR
jgi:hypothetical protein